MAENNNTTAEYVPLMSKELEDDQYFETKSNEDETLGKSLVSDEQVLESWQVALHLFKVFVGVGVLGLPSAFFHCGIVGGPIALTLIGLVTIYGTLLLARTSNEISTRTGIASYTYGELAKEIIILHSESVGSFAKIFIDTVICVMHFGFCVVYFGFYSGTMVKILDSPHPRLWTAAFLPLVLGLALITNIRKLVYATIIANIGLVVAFLIMFQYLIPHMKSPTHGQFRTNQLAFMIGFGQLLYGFEGIGAIPMLQNKTRIKEKFPQVLVSTLFAVMVLFLSFALAGYLAFGLNTKPSVTFNLPDEPLYQMLNGAYLLIVLFTYPVIFYVPIDIIKCHLEENLSKNKLIFAEYSVRISMVFLTAALAIAIPQLDNYMALIGSSTATVVTFIVPPILHTLCFWNEGLQKWQLVLNVMTCVFGIFAFVCGTFSSIIAIIRRLENSSAL